MKQQLKQDEYAMKMIESLSDFLAETVKPDDEDFDATALIHVIANVVPSLIYSQITGEEINMLEFNHIANRLCFQYLNKVEE